MEEPSDELRRRVGGVAEIETLVAGIAGRGGAVVPELVAGSAPNFVGGVGAVVDFDDVVAGGGHGVAAVGFLVV